jgi:delta-aminolevulinic acid dehydratase/porphobilinogen synthase
MSKSQLHTNIMRRVNRVYWLRRVFSTTAVQCTSLLLFIFGVSSLISVGDVVANMPQTLNVFTQATFHIEALKETEGLVQANIIALILITLWVMRDMVRYALYKTIPAFRTSRTVLR